MFGGLIVSYLGALIRWIIGSLLNIISKKPLLSYKKYLYGPKNFENLYETKTANIDNFFVGIAVIIIISFLSAKKFI